jgi:hypothetical protein
MHSRVRGVSLPLLPSFPMDCDPAYGSIRGRVVANRTSTENWRSYFPRHRAWHAFRQGEFRQLVSRGVPRGRDPRTGSARRAPLERPRMGRLSISSWPCLDGRRKMALLYTRKADRKRLARDAAPLLLPAHFENENACTLGPVRESDEIPDPNQDDNIGVVPRRGLEPPRLLTTGT